MRDPFLKSAGGLQTADQADGADRHGALPGAHPRNAKYIGARKSKFLVQPSTLDQ
jgi:hypothetical protein